ncbi:phage scaffolding protein [Bifidobacterium pluvialisilvae]|uniref:phage scaffolding protein n=1 Tax=Bifidobacterium pluvialisilvae TaxID=2834436 RepID=UPI001F31B3E5|nr:hypothetical protein [Bifidobacterium pluvialisilvae]
MDQNQTDENKPNEDGQTPPETDWQSKYEAQRKVNRDLERKLKEAYGKSDKVDALERQVAELQGKEAEYEAAKKEQSIKDEALQQANQRILKAEIRAAASGRLNDPSDALRYLDLSKFSVSDDGDVDTQAIGTALDGLVKEKPYLGKAGNPTGPQGIIPPSGTRDGDRGAGQLTRDDLKTMKPEAIVKAKSEGRLDDILGINK